MRFVREVDTQVHRAHSCKGNSEAREKCVGKWLKANSVGGGDSEGLGIHRAISKVTMPKGADDEGVSNLRYYSNGVLEDG
mgnify:CR=1 FL=1